MIDKEVVSKMENGQNKKLMEILAEKGKPYEKKHDGYAVKVEEDKQITWTDYNNAELTMTVPKGSYIMVAEDSSCPKVVTEKEFDDSNKFCDYEEPAKKEAQEEHETKESTEKEKKEEEAAKKSSPKIGLESMM